MFYTVVLLGSTLTKVAQMLLIFPLLSIHGQVWAYEAWPAAASPCEIRAQCQWGPLPGQ